MELYTVVVTAMLLCISGVRVGAESPNIILVMADDLGWGDAAYNGNKIVRTPHLDAMSREGIRLDQFYAAAPVCSPTRGSCLTGRHPFRYGITWAGETPLDHNETTIAEVLRQAGYATGHFGKWHVGGLSRTVKQSYFEGPVDLATYSPPWENGFDECFSTESMMPTYNPYYHLGGEFGTPEYRHLQTEPVAKGQRNGGFRWRDSYWTGPGQLVDEWLEGDDSKLIMDRALDFIARQHKSGKPSLTLIWFHSVHTPMAASDADREPYTDQPMQAQHWFGAITAMDRQLGRLRSWLRAAAKKARRTMPELALAWVFRQPAITSVLVGARTPRHVDQAFEAMKMAHEPGLRSVLDDLANHVASPGTRIHES